MRVQKTREVASIVRNTHIYPEEGKSFIMQIIHMSIPLLLVIQVSVRQQFNQRYSDLALLGHLFQGDTVLSQLPWGFLLVGHA